MALLLNPLPRPSRTQPMAKANLSDILFVSFAGTIRRHQNDMSKQTLNEPFKRV